MKPGSPLELPPVSPALRLPWRWAGTTRSNGSACLVHFLIQSTTTVVESPALGLDEQARFLPGCLTEGQE